MPGKAILLVFGLLLSACAVTPTPIERVGYADDLAVHKGWRSIVIPAGRFDLVAYIPQHVQPGDELTVYIEGDGFAWVSRAQVSSDPTPRDPIALRLALAHPEGNAVYLARPCQYVGAKVSGCSEQYWAEKRFAPEVVDTSNRAVDELKRRFKAHRLTLVGYSGGAAIAALVAARRDDVDRLVTVAGNLDPEAWALHNHLRPLTGSLNPVDVGDTLQSIRQWHFVGGRDRVVPASLIQSFVERFPAERQPVIYIEPEYDHHCCWAANWRRLWLRAMGAGL